MQTVSPGLIICKQKNLACLTCGSLEADLCYHLGLSKFSFYFPIRTEHEKKECCYLSMRSRTQVEHKRFIIFVAFHRLVFQEKIPREDSSKTVLHPLLHPATRLPLPLSINDVIHQHGNDVTKPIWFVTPQLLKRFITTTNLSSDSSYKNKSYFDSINITLSDLLPGIYNKPQIWKEYVDWGICLT